MSNVVLFSWTMQQNKFVWLQCQIPVCHSFVKSISFFLTKVEVCELWLLWIFDPTYPFSLGKNFLKDKRFNIPHFKIIALALLSPSHQKHQCTEQKKGSLLTQDAYTKLSFKSWNAYTWEFSELYWAASWLHVERFCIAAGISSIKMVGATGWLMTPPPFKVSHMHHGHKHKRGRGLIT